jgi:hypothetical protein
MFLYDAIISWGLRVPTPPARGLLPNPLHSHQQGLCSPAPAKGWFIFRVGKTGVGTLRYLLRSQTQKCLRCDSHRTTPVLPGKISTSCLALLVNKHFPKKSLNLANALKDELLMVWIDCQRKLTNKAKAQ